MDRTESTSGYSQIHSNSSPRSKASNFGHDLGSASNLDLPNLDVAAMTALNTSGRKDSLTANNSNGVLSPADSLQQSWDHHFSTGMTTDQTSAVAPLQFPDDTRAYITSTPLQSSNFTQQHQQPQWPMDSTAMMSPFVGDFMSPPQQFGNMQYVAQPLSGSHVGYPQVQGSMHYAAPHPGSQYMQSTAQLQSPLSPHVPVDHMALAAHEADNRQSRRMRADSPQRTILDSRQGDGVRKKNNRIDIPAGRNINNIDQLIENETDEGIIRELKSQKRLLRNREAALQSRQRKKKHTEELEVKEKEYTSQISMYEAALSNQQSLEQSLAHSQHIIEVLQQEKREMMAEHNEETANLRRKIRLLQDRLDIGPAPSMSAVPSSTGFTELNAGVEAMSFGAHDTLGPHEWDDFIYASQITDDGIDQFNFDGPHSALEPLRVVDKKSSTTTLVPVPQKTPDVTTEQPVASGLLFMLLLCGAFVASKPPSAQPAGMPKVPAAVHAVAPTVLSSLLESDSTLTQHPMRSSVGALPEPMPSIGSVVSSSGPDRIGDVYRSVTAPTRQQQFDQAFALTPAQYASLTSTEYAEGVHEPKDSATRPRRNLAEALSALEEKHPHNSKAEVYTRSLLWDRIPADVVQQFKEMVRDHHQIETRNAAEASDSFALNDALKLEA